MRGMSGGFFNAATGAALAIFCGKGPLLQITSGAGLGAAGTGPLFGSTGPLLLARKVGSSGALFFSGVEKNEVIFFGPAGEAFFAEGITTPLLDVFWAAAILVFWLTLRLLLFEALVEPIDTFFLDLESFREARCSQAQVSVRKIVGRDQI